MHEWCTCLKLSRSAGGFGSGCERSSSQKSLSWIEPHIEIKIAKKISEMTLGRDFVNGISHNHNV